MKFYKYHGLGNDFVLVNADAERGIDFRKISVAVCDRHFGIGADNLVTFSRRSPDTYLMRIYNSDGSEAEMCGNATRCIAKHLRKCGLISGNEVWLETRAGLIHPVVRADGLVTVDMGEPRPGEINRNVGGFTGTEISMGNPHFVIFVSELEGLDLSAVGPVLENDPVFPDKSNIEFVRVLAPDRVRMRVWERGCGVTLACGTGSCAAAAAGVLTGRTAREVEVVLDGGSLFIRFDANDNHLYMTGPATEVFQGVYHG